MPQEAGAIPVLGAVYPNGDYSLEHYGVLQDTHQRMLTWGVTVLDWFAALEDGKGCWKPGLSFDPAHPNTIGHQQMYAAIDRSYFQLTQTAQVSHSPGVPPVECLLYHDSEGFLIFVRPTEPSLRIINRSRYSYSLSPNWQELQTAIREHPNLARLNLRTAH